MDSAQVVREEIWALLERFVATPGRYLREKDLQAALWAAVHARIDADVPGIPVDVVSPRGGATGHAYDGLITARAHVEIEVVEWLPANKERLDLVVLRDDLVPQLTCENNGPTDFWQRLRGEDLAVAVEIKASPSTYSRAPADYAKDLAKLCALKAQFPRVEAMFVLFDKALSLPAARGLKGPAQWEAKAALDLHATSEGAGTAVEVWDLANGAPARVRQRFCSCRDRATPAGP